MRILNFFRRLFYRKNSRREESQPLASTSQFYKQSPAEVASRLIVFVHGVLGGAATTWGQPGDPNFWPAVVESDPRFSNYDIYLVNYRSPLFGRAPNIYEVAISELNYLEDRGIFDRYREVHFIAHSMGGLVVKRMLVRLRDRSEAKKLRRILTLVCLSTPAQGASVAALGHLFSNNPQFDGLTESHLNESIQELEDSWAQLLRSRNKNGDGFPQIHCAYETLPMHGVLVVPRDKAYTLCDTNLHPMALDHTGMVTVTGRDADPYLWTMARVLEASHEFAERESFWFGQSKQPWI